MTDSTQVLDAGWQMPLNTAENPPVPYNDGIIYFFDAGTTNAKTVYSDATLSTSLGVSVSCNSLGFPVTSGNAKTLIYVGSAAYKIRITSATFGGTIFEADNVRGALDTSVFLTSAAVADESVVNTSSNLTLTTAHKGHLINSNCTAGSLTYTCDPASTLGDGWYVLIRHAGTANQVKVTGNGTDVFELPGVGTTAFALTGRGQLYRITTDGTKFLVTAVAPELIANTTGVIKIADRLTAPPGSPTPGARYLLTGAGSGAWSTFAAGDIAEANGAGGWFKYTPATDCGWIAYVQDEQVPYQFRGTAWARQTSGLVAVQRFTTGSGTYTPNPNAVYIRVRMVGGGAGGGGQSANNGATGGTTTFGGWTCVGGVGGIGGEASNTAGNQGGAGGTGGTTGTGTLLFRTAGQAGSKVASGNTAASNGGSGGNSIFGGGGQPGHHGNAGGNALPNTGSGGGGAQGNATLNDGTGGGAGEYVEFFVSNPVAVSYAVGALGAGGAAGGFAGGDGAAGIIIVEEYL